MEESAALVGRTVIIADDDEIVRGLLRALLRVAGMDVVAETANGERTVAAYTKYHPDIVCLDINMPGTDGLEVLAQIRAMSSEAIILIISADTTRENMRKAIDGKADGVIVKPFNTGRVTSELERILKLRADPGPESRPE